MLSVVSWMHIYITYHYSSYASVWIFHPDRHIETRNILFNQINVTLKHAPSLDIAPTRNLSSIQHKMTGTSQVKKVSMIKKNDNNFPGENIKLILLWVPFWGSRHYGMGSFGRQGFTSTPR